jgi:hypothetical protein
MKHEQLTEITEGESKMKFRYLIALLLLATPPYTALAQAPQAKTKYEDETPPPIVEVVTGSKAERELLSTLLSIKPQIPLGPDYILQGYENEMTLVSQKMSVELQNIERALRSGQITHDEAEYLIQQRYRVAMMQYEVFTALHDALEQEIQQAAADSNSFSAKGSAGAVAARLAASPSHPQGQ